jgi:hypothetical protein
MINAFQNLGKSRDSKGPHGSNLPPSTGQSSKTAGHALLNDQARPVPVMRVGYRNPKNSLDLRLAKPFELYPEQVNLCAQRSRRSLMVRCLRGNRLFMSEEKRQIDEAIDQHRAPQTYTISTRQALRCSQP